MRDYLGARKILSFVDIYAFSLLKLFSDEIIVEREWDKIELLRKKLEFQVPRPNCHQDRPEIENVVKEVRIFMKDGHYLVDGIVFSYNGLTLHEELGSTAHHPRYRMAFKFQGESKRTRIIEIIWSVSRNGHLIPVGNVEPVELSGAKISRVTLHNYGQVKQHKLKCGDEIEIVRSGEVIPKFLTTVKPSQNKWEVPNQCPVCQSVVELNDIHLVCSNKKCPGIVKENILNFVQKIGIDDLSSKRLDAMLREGLVASIPDLYKLNKEKLLTLEKTKEKIGQQNFIRD